MYDPDIIFISFHDHLMSLPIGQINVVDVCVHFPVVETHTQEELYSTFTTDKIAVILTVLHIPKHPIIIPPHASQFHYTIEVLLGL